MITWEKLCEIEPRLVDLHNDCKSESSADNPHFCANRTWYDKYKPRLVRLVGDHAAVTNYDLMGHEAYDIAYRKCYEALPDCRDCSCMRF